MNNERSRQIIDKAIDLIENGQSVPLSMGKVSVNREEMLSILRELDNIVSGELKIYREITDRKGKIITEAKNEAEAIINEAEQSASRIRVTKRMSSVTQKVNTKGLAMDEKLALRTANDIYAASLIYTDEMLTEVNDVVSKATQLMNDEYIKIVETLQEKAKIISDNKAELMTNLKDLSKQERYNQILELGQLLSNELYNERIKAYNSEIDEEIDIDKIEDEEIDGENLEDIETDKKMRELETSKFEIEQTEVMMTEVEGDIPKPQSVMSKAEEIMPGTENMMFKAEKMIEENEINMQKVKSEIAKENRIEEI